MSSFVLSETEFQVKAVHCYPRHLQCWKPTKRSRMNEKSKHPGLDLNWTVLLYLTFSVPIVTVCTNHSTFEDALQICPKKSCCMQGHKIDCLYSRYFGGWGWLRNGWIIINGNRIWFLWLTIYRASQNYGYIQTFFNVENVVNMFFQEIIVNILATATT